MIRTDDASGTIVREITIEAPADKVFAALTEPKQLVLWWGGDGSYRCTDMSSDLRVGGAWRTTGADAAGKAFTVEGVYRVIERPALLEYTWRHDWGSEVDRETVVRFELTERDGVTHVRLTHSGFTDEESRDDHAAGWLKVLGWLSAYFR